MRRPDRYDVVVVGAGSAGCVLAARLTDEPERRVLLLEAGPVFSDEASVPPDLLDERTFPQDHLWYYEGIHHRDGPDRSTTVVRGRVAGGSGSVNGMIWQRGLPEDYDGWGLDDWCSEALEPFFDRLERDVDRGERDGLVPVHRLGREHWSRAHAAFHDAARAAGHPESPDLLHPEHPGVGAYARNGEGGRRTGAALDVLLPALDRPNLDVLGDAAVVRVVLQGSRAVGVDVRRAGAETRIDAGRVVLCAGALETPQLLVHSGVGPARTIEALGLEPLVDLPGVGQGLSDHPSVVPTLRTTSPVRAGDLRCLVGLVHTSASERAAGGRSDLQTFPMSGPHVGNLEGRLAPDPTAVDLTLTSVLYAPESRGHVEVVAVDPAVRPRVHYGYLESPKDRERLREAVRRSAELWRHEAVAALIADDAGAPDPGTLDDDAALDRWVRANLQSTLHGCGTCRMGPDADPDAVVDARCRVRGVDGLWVADLSVVPRAPRAATNATAMVLAERLAAWW